MNKSSSQFNTIQNFYNQQVIKEVLHKISILTCYVLVSIGASQEKYVHLTPTSQNRILVYLLSPDDITTR
jgi:hypothetical protein